MFRSIRKMLVSGSVIAVGVLSVAAGTVGGSGQAKAQNAQWNALFDRIIRLEANVKNLSRGGGAGGGYQRTQSNEQMRQLLREVQQMRQQLLGMDARLRRLEKNAGRSGAVRRKTPTYSRSYNPPAAVNPNSSAFAEADINQYGVDGEPKIFVEIGEPKAKVPVAPVARNPAVKNPGIARTPTNWQSTLPKQPAAVAPNIAPKRNAGQYASLQPPTNSGGGVVRQTLDGAQITDQSLAKQLYDRSAAALRNRRYASAESGFKSFLRKYGSDKLASSAQFMLGETYYVQRNWRLAAQTYLKGYRKYPKGARAGDTLLKLGMALNKLGQKSQSCGAFETVVSKYKSSRNAVSQAKKEMKRARC